MEGNAFNFPHLFFLFPAPSFLPFPPLFPGPHLPPLLPWEGSDKWVSMLQALGASADWESTGAHNGPVVLATHEAFQELPLAGQE